MHDVIFSSSTGVMISYMCSLGGGGWGGADIYCEEDLNSYDGRWTVTNVFDPIEHINKDTAYYSVWSTVCIR